VTDIPLDLLWRAWPDGYLPMRGVSTVGGWVCMGAKPAHALATFRTRNGPLEVLAPSTRTALSGDTDSVSLGIIRAGALLPLVDPADIATWACLVHDLGVAMNKMLPAAPGPAPTLPWGSFAFDRSEPGFCMIYDSAHNPRRQIRWMLTIFDNADALLHDLPLALVYSRIACRERGF